MKTNKKARRDHRLKHLQQEENKRILKRRKARIVLTIDEQFKFINTLPYEDLRRLDHILGNRESAFERSKKALDSTKERRNTHNIIKEQLDDLENSYETV